MSSWSGSLKQQMAMLKPDINYMCGYIYTSPYQSALTPQLVTLKKIVNRYRIYLNSSRGYLFQPPAIVAIIQGWLLYEGGSYFKDRVHTSFLTRWMPGSCLSFMCICFVLLDTGFCGWFYFLSFFLLYILASML